MITDELSQLARELGGASADLARTLASLVTASHDFIGIADLEGNALFVNEAGRRLVGLPDLEAVRSTRIVDYFAPDDQPKIVAGGLARRSPERLLGGRSQDFAILRPASWCRCYTTSIRFAMHPAPSPPTEPSRAI